MLCDRYLSYFAVQNKPWTQNVNCTVGLLNILCLFYVMCPGDIVYTLPPLKNMTRLAYVKRPSQQMLKHGICSWISICVEIIKWSTKSIGRFRWYNIMFDHITLQQVFRSFTVDISFAFAYFQHHFIWQPYKSFLWAFLSQLCLLILDKSRQTSAYLTTSGPGHIHKKVATLIVLDICR